MVVRGMGDAQVQVGGAQGELGGREWDEWSEGEGELRWGAPAWACGGLGCGSELCGYACSARTSGACEQGVVRMACIVGECGART